MKIPVSVVVLCRNEADNLPACLQSLRDFVDIIVFDSHSTDSSPDIAHEFGARLEIFDWNGHNPRKKQAALNLSRLRHDWVLLCDADERMTPECAAAIATAILHPRHRGFFLTYRWGFAGKELRFGLKNRKLALLHRHHAHFPPEPTNDGQWEVEGHIQPVIDGTIGYLGPAMIHHDAKPLAHWFERHNHYSDWESAREVAPTFPNRYHSETGLRRHLKRLFYRLPARGLWAFLHCYIVKLGFLDGIAGLDFALSRGFYYWQISVKRRALMRQNTAGNQIRNRHSSD